MGNRIIESLLRQVNAVIHKKERWAVPFFMDETIPKGEVHMHYIDKNRTPRCEVIRSDKKQL